MEVESRPTAAAVDLDLLESRVPYGGLIPLPISRAIAADQGLTCLTADCFRGHRRRWIKQLILPMGSAGGDVGNGMTVQPVTEKHDSRHNSVTPQLTTVFSSPKMFSAWSMQVAVSQGQPIYRC
jgi:hypothetical protein